MTLASDQNPDELGLSSTSRQFMAIRADVMTRWERETRARVDGAQVLLSPVLTNMLPAFLDNIAEALSPNHPRRTGTSNNSAAAAHGGERARMTRFGPDQIVHEYQILRECIACEAAGRVPLTHADWAIIDMSINAAVRDAVREFASIQEELRRKLAAALSHDMRTPLGVVLNGAELVGVAPDLEVARRAAGKIAASAERLGQMMAELLDALIFQGGPRLALTLSRFDIADLMHEVCQEYSQKAGVRFEAGGESVPGYWCRSSMRRALENLVNNAIRYGDGESVRLQARQAHGRLMLTVHNAGAPIPPERHGHIFEYQPRAGGTAAGGGWGIGLPFVKTVAENHGGSAAVDSSRETGTTFIIDVPVDCRPFAGDAPDAGQG